MPSDANSERQDRKSKKPKPSKIQQQRKDQAGQRRPRSLLLPIAIAIFIIIVAGVAALIVFRGHSSTQPTGSITNSSTSKPIILYENQENSPVNTSNFGALVQFARSQGFNTIFFQISRNGSLLSCCDTQGDLQYFVTASHVGGEKIFFVLAFSNSSQSLPSSSFVYKAGEDGIDLDMSTLPPLSQSNLLSALKSVFNGTTAVTTYNFSTTLKPDWLIFETYDWASDVQYVHAGIIASVEVLNAGSKQNYESEFNTALRNSDGVMVFDYWALKNKGY
jgi:hypothetical protein